MTKMKSKVIKVRPMSEIDSTYDSQAKPVETKDSSEEQTADLKVKALNFFKRINVNGLAHAIEPTLGHSRRVLWIFLLLVSFAFLCFQFVTQIIYYQKFPTKVEFRRVYPPELDFPILSFCNENVLSKSKILALKDIHGQALSDDIAEYLKTVFEPWRFLHGFIPHSALRKLNTMNVESLDWNSLYRNVSFTPDEIASKVIIKNSLTANTRGLLKKVATEFGLCTSFDPEGMSTANSGPFFGMFLLFNIPPEDHFASPSVQQGIRIQIHERGIFPTIFYKGFGIPTGGITEIQLSVVNHKRMEHPYGNCSSVPLKHFDSYRKSNCLLECIGNLEMSKCGCVDFSLHEILNMKLCSPRDQLFCAMITRYYVEPGTCNCPDDCEETSYGISSAFNYFSNTYIEELAKEMNMSGNHSAVKERFAAVNIYFPSIEYDILTTEEEYTLILLLCDLGGALGLLLGSSFLTIYEIIEFSILLSYEKMKRCKK